MTNLDHMLKSRDINLQVKVCLVKALVFLVVMDECESWTIKKAEHQIIDAFELYCVPFSKRVGKHLIFPWTARRSNQLFLKEITPEPSFKGLILKVKLQYFGHLV